MFRMQTIFWKQPIADDAVAAVNTNTEFQWVVKSLSILSCESLQDKTCRPVVMAASAAHLRRGDVTASNVALKLRRS